MKEVQLPENMEQIHFHNNYNTMPSCEGKRRDRNSRNYIRICGRYSKFKCKLCNKWFCKACSKKHDADKCKEKRSQKK